MTDFYLSIVILGLLLWGACFFGWLAYQKISQLKAHRQAARETLEEKTVDAMRRKGRHDAKRWKGVDDGGVDAFGHKDGEFRVVQCKRYSATNYVKVEEVRALVGSMVDTARKGQRCMMVTTWYLSKRAREYCQRNGVVVVDKSKIVDFLK